MRFLSPWVVRRACRWAGIALALVLVVSLLPTWWAVLRADSSIADSLCNRTNGCDQAYFCPSSSGGLRPHIALCMEGQFVPQEVDAAGWRTTLTGALPDSVVPWLPDDVTVRWLTPSWRTPR